MISKYQQGEFHSLLSCSGLLFLVTSIVGFLPQIRIRSGKAVGGGGGGGPDPSFTPSFRRKSRISNFLHRYPYYRFLSQSRKNRDNVWKVECKFLS